MKLEIKTTIIIALTIAVIILSTCNSCRESSYKRKIAKLEQGYKTGSVKLKSDTVFKTDTMRAIIDNPVPYEVTKTEKVIDWHFDTLRIENIPVDIDSLVQDYLATRKYDTTITTDYGEIQLKQVVTENKLTTDTIIPTLKIPTITNTITEVRIEKRGIVYLGFDAYGNKKEWINGAGFSVQYKSPNALAYEIALKLDSTGVGGRASIKFPLSFRKH